VHHVTITTVPAVAELLDDLCTVPLLPGAACKGRTDVFDDLARATEALQICAGCPALAACRDWLESTSYKPTPVRVPRRQPPGVEGVAVETMPVEKVPEPPKGVAVPERRVVLGPFPHVETAESEKPLVRGPFGTRFDR
jgi:hypothetical protein